MLVCVGINGSSRRIKEEGVPNTACTVGDIIFLENDSFTENLILSLESHLHLSSGLSPIGRWDNLCLLLLGCLLPFPAEYSIVA